MPTSPLTVRLDEELEEALDRYCQESGRSRGDVVREALRRQFTLPRFEKVRERILPFVEARGYLTDQDVFDELRRLLREKIGLPEGGVGDALRALEEHRVVPTAEPDPDVEVDDSPDARLLATALAAGAEVLVTGD